MKATVVSPIPAPSRPDSSWSENQYNLLDEVTKVSDSSGYCVTNWYNNQGLLCASSNAAGVVNFRQFDAANRATQTVGNDGVVVTNAFDALGRLLRISRNSDAVVEEFEYGFTGLLAATRDLQTTYYLNDVAGRRVNEQNPNLEETWFGYDVADRLASLTDPQNNSTQWGYDAYGHVTLKLDANGASMFTYAYDAEGRLTNRWSPAKGNTGYAYDALGNLTNADYPTSPDLHFAYDALRRLTNLVDAVGMTRYQYTSAGLLQSEDGPFENDMVSYGYTNRLRSSVSLPDAAGGPAWTQGYGYDAAARLASVSSPAGVFGYTYGTTPANRPSLLNLPGGSQIGYTYDGLARLTGTELKDPTGTSLHRHTYAYAAQTDRIATMSRLDGSSVDYGYDASGHLVAASGYLTYTPTRRVHEQFNYGDIQLWLRWRRKPRLAEHQRIHRTVHGQ